MNTSHHAHANGQSMEGIATALQRTLHELPSQELQQAGSFFDSALSRVETASLQGAAGEVMVFGGYLALARCATAEAATAVGECETHIGNYVAANTSRAGRGDVIALPSMQGLATTEDGKRFLTDETAALIPGVMEGLRPLAKTGSLRSYHDVLAAQSDAVLCELLRHDVPFADEVLLQRHISLLYKLAWDLLRKRPERGLTPDDLVARGAEVYLQVARRHIEGETKLNTYAAHSAGLEMRKIADIEGNQVSIPHRVIEMLSQVQKEEARRMKLGELPMTDEELSELLGGLPLEPQPGKHVRTVADVRRAQQLTRNLMHVDLGEQEVHGQHGSVYVAAEDLLDMGGSGQVVSGTDEQALRRIVGEYTRKALDTMPPMYAVVIRGLYGIGQPVETHLEIGKRMGMTRKEVQEAENNALMWLAKHHPHLAELMD